VLKVSCGFDGSPTGRDDLVEKGATLKIDLGFDQTWKPDQNAPPRAVLTNHVEKTEWETDPSELRKVNTLKADQFVRAAITMKYPDETPGAKKWKH
jgi:hypothetical protein